MKKTPMAQLRMRKCKWWIDLTYNQLTRKRFFTIGPMTWDQAKKRYEDGAKAGRWMKEEIGDR